MEMAPGEGGWCRGDAYATIRIVEVRDDRTRTVDLGFTVTIVDGDPPPDLYVAQYPILSRDGGLPLFWLVRRSQRIPPVDFTVVITAIDLAGNEGPASEPIRIHHEWIGN